MDAPPGAMDAPPAEPAAALEALEAALPRELTRPEAHPGDPHASLGVEVLQTHLSWVFLSAARVVKLRKAVRLPFVDFGTRALRNADCLREVRLNRRLAPDVYLGVAPVLRGAPGWRVGPVAEELAPGEDGETPEHVVVMRRLAAGRDALTLLEGGALQPAHLDAVARVLADFHGKVGLGRPAPFGAEAWLDLLAGPMAANFASLRETLPHGVGEDALRRVEELFAVRLAACAGRLELRRREGRAVDGHGDVHLQHVWFEAGPERPLLVDCIEFSEGLRRIDTAGEVAFLAMDLAYRGRGDLAARFLRRYAELADDFGLFAVVDLYTAYRAAVRGKVAGLAARDAAMDAGQRRAAAESAARHLALAERFLAAPRPGPVIALCGSVGSGKTTVAERLADLLAGAVISSDRTRKRLAGLAPEARAGAGLGEGLYTPAWSDRTYAALLERAEPVVASGRATLLDASFAEAARRRAVLAFAEALGAPAWLVEVRCSETTALARLARRAREGRDASDAGPELLAASAARIEAPAEWPRERHLVMESDAPDFDAQLAAAAAAAARGR